MIFVQGECARCGTLINGSTADQDGDTADLYLTVPGRGHFAGSVFRAVLICKNAMLCGERARHA